LVGCNPVVREYVYDANMDHPLDRRFSTAVTTPL
jgi:hypothetical protein